MNISCCTFRCTFVETLSACSWRTGSYNKVSCTLGKLKKNGDFLHISRKKDSINDKNACKIPFPRILSLVFHLLIQISSYQKIRILISWYFRPSEWSFVEMFISINWFFYLSFLVFFFLFFLNFGTACRCDHLIHCRVTNPAKLKLRKKQTNEENRKENYGGK